MVYSIPMQTVSHHKSSVRFHEEDSPPVVNKSAWPHFLTQRRFVQLYHLVEPNKSPRGDIIRGKADGGFGARCGKGEMAQDEDGNGTCYSIFPTYIGNEGGRQIRWSRTVSEFTWYYSKRKEMKWRTNAKNELI